MGSSTSTGPTIPNTGPGEGSTGSVSWEFGQDIKPQVDTQTASGAENAWTSMGNYLEQVSQDLVQTRNDNQSAWEGKAGEAAWHMLSVVQSHVADGYAMFNEIGQSISAQIYSLRQYTTDFNTQAEQIDSQVISKIVLMKANLSKSGTQSTSTSSASSS
jgi:hypothetical protein